MQWLMNVRMSTPCPVQCALLLDGHRPATPSRWIRTCTMQPPAPKAMMRMAKSWYLKPNSVLRYWLLVSCSPDESRELMTNVMASLTNSELRFTIDNPCSSLGL